MSLSVIVNGKTWHRYSAEYALDDRRYSFDFYAISDDHAVEVLRAIHTTAVEASRVEAVIPSSSPFALWRIRLTCWWRSLIA